MRAMQNGRASSSASRASFWLDVLGVWNTFGKAFWLAGGLPGERMLQSIASGLAKSRADWIRQTCLFAIVLEIVEETIFRAE